MKKLRGVDPDDPPFNHDAQAIFHDHFEGSSHCVECGGRCSLTDPTQQALTSIVRAVFESEAYNSAISLPWSLLRTLERHGVRVDHVRRRAIAIARKQDNV